MENCGRPKQGKSFGLPIARKLRDVHRLRNSERGIRLKLYLFL